MSSEKNIEKSVLAAVDDEEDAATNFNQTTESGDGENDQILTMQDVLDEQDELEKEYAAVLGGSDHKCCTYSKVCDN